MDELEIFAAVVATNDPGERAALLDRECAGRPELKERLALLLEAHLKSYPLLDQPNQLELQATQDHPSKSPLVGAVVAGRYKLVEEIGDGGMGTVWMAEQKEPVKRLVAVKLIKAGMDSKAVLARFEAERQALALMDHPHIAKIHDAGTDSSGRPYFVMELVKGLPLTDYCDARKLSVHERLALFVQICSAVQHAHQKAVIHRDLKPSNILVTEHDGKPVPKVIDFGLAKALNASQMLTDQTLHTAYGTVVGTPLYMAPEQVGINALDVDTRSDIYSLGVILYELLTGSTPLEKAKFREAAWDEVKRLIREVEPPRPSMRLSSAATLPSLAATRQIEPAKLSALLKGEIDWIVMKSLEKDRSRRYESASNLAKDVQRYLMGDAVEACPPTLGYRLRKAYRRNRLAVLVGATFLLMLITGVTVTTVLAIQARRSEALARLKEQEAQEQRQEAERNKEAWLKVSEAHMEVAIDAIIRSQSARLDADLLEYKADARMGLLKLARPLTDTFTIPSIGPNFSGTNTIRLKGPEFVKLREFQTAAVVSAGQEFVPLLPLIDYYCDTDMLPPFDDVGPDEVSPDGSFYLGHTDQLGVQMWAIPSLSYLGLLREAKERVMRFGFTSDSETIYTQDEHSVLRFWNTDGTLRAKTPLRHERYIYPDGMSHKQVRFTALYNRAMVANGVAAVWSQQRFDVTPSERQSDWAGTPGPVGPKDLYSTRTGQFIRRLGTPERKLKDLQLSPDEDWLIYTEHQGESVAEVVILSSVEGNELARLKHNLGGANELNVKVSPTGKWILTDLYNLDPVTLAKRSRRLYLWNTKDWQPIDDPAVLDAFEMLESYEPYFLNDEIIAADWAEDGSSGIGVLKGIGFQINQPQSRNQLSDLFVEGRVISEKNGKLLRSGRVLIDPNTWQRLNSPRGRKYHPDLAKIALDGRFFENLDTVTEKELPGIHSFEGKILPGIGRVHVRIDRLDNKDGTYWSLEEPHLHILPDPNRLDTSPKLLELWAQVVVGGELDEAGVFQAWDQPTWAAKQKELAAMKSPYEDFPFPGWAASEPNLWYRIQANMASNDAEREQLLDEWRRRSGRVRPELEPDTWRTPGPDKPEEQP